MTRIKLWRLLRDRGPMTAKELYAAFPEHSISYVQNRLSVFANNSYEAFEIRRVKRGVYAAGEKQYGNR